MTTPDWQCARCGCTADRETASATWTTVITEQLDDYLYEIAAVCPNCVTQLDRETDLKQIELDARARWHEWHTDE
jgi:hypothetical protein